MDGISTESVEAQFGILEVRLNNLDEHITDIVAREKELSPRTILKQYAIMKGGFN